jgi:5-methylcytosine-specific restriction endonuclease McrA
MENMSYFDNQSIVSELTENSDNIENFDFKIEEIRNKLINDLNKLNIDLIKDKCKELGITGLSKLKKPELIQLLETEFFKMQTYLISKSKNELKLLCKNCDVKRVSATKKEYLVYQILLYNANNMIFKIIDNTQQTVTENASDNQPQLSLIEQLEKQKQEIELKMQEEIKKKEEEAKRLIEEEEKKKAEEEKKRIEEEKKEAKKKKQSIPKNVRMIVWNHYIGEDIIKHKCLCCKKVTISNTNFEVGHVLSEKNGGTHEINNLRPICFACNHSMGAENMIDFVVKFGLYIG